MKLLDIFKKHGVDLKHDDYFRHPIDILEDLYLKINMEEYAAIMKTIADSESKEGFIFDLARNRPYE